MPGVMHWIVGNFTDGRSAIVTVLAETARHDYSANHKERYGSHREHCGKTP